MIPLAVLERASRTARLKREWTYVWEDSEEPGGYGVGNDDSAETWYLGQTPVACFGPDGGRES